MVATALGAAVPFGVGITSAEQGGKRDLAKAFARLIKRHGSPSQEGVVVVRNNDELYSEGQVSSQPPRAVGTPAIGTFYKFEDGYTAQYWSSLSGGEGEKPAVLDGVGYSPEFTESDQSAAMRRMTELNASTNVDVTADATADINLFEGYDNTYSFSSASGGATDSDVIPLASTNEDYITGDKEAYADAKVFAGGQAESVAEVWKTVSSYDSGGVEFTISGTWSGSMFATPGCSSAGKVSVFIREVSDTDNEIDSGEILNHTAPVYGDYWQKRSSYSNWDGADNTVFANINKDKTYQVGARIKCTSSALDLSSPLPGSVRSDFFRKDEPLDPTTGRKFVSIDSIEVNWPNV